MTRVLDVARIQLINWPTLIAYPLATLVVMPVLALGIDASNGELFARGHNLFLLPMLWGVAGSAHLQTMTQVFPFALGLGVTRRTFAAATALVVVAHAALFSFVLLGFRLVEQLTDGWGRHSRIFEMPPQAGPVTQWLVYAGPLLAVSALCVLVGIVFQRWRQTGIYLAVLGVIALVAGKSVVSSSMDWWPSFGDFFTGQPDLVLYAGYPTALALLLGGAGWFALRRSTP